MDNTDADQRLPHRLSGAPDIAIEELRGIGVNYWKVNCVESSYQLGCDSHAHTDELMQQYDRVYS